MIISILCFLLGGAIAGLLAGLLGIGGGLVIVPFLALILTWQGLPSELIMHTAVATSLAVIIFTSLSSVRAQHRRGAINWSLVRKLLPGIIIGAIAGVVIAGFIPGNALRRLFAVFVLLMAARMLFNFNLTGKAPSLPGRKGLFVASGMIGTLCTLFGMGGGAFIVPYLEGRQVAMRNAIAAGATCGFPIALTGTITYFISGFNEMSTSAYMLGYVYLPAWVCIAFASVMCAPLGVRLSHTLKPQILQRIFALFLVVVAVEMFLE